MLYFCLKVEVFKNEPNKNEELSAIEKKYNELMQIKSSQEVMLQKMELKLKQYDERNEMQINDQKVLLEQY